MLKTKSGRWVMLPTEEEDKAIEAAAMADPDAPLLTDEQLADMRPLLELASTLRENKCRKAQRDYLNKGESDA